MISESGGQVGVLSGDGLRALSRSRGDGFATRSWLENDGDAADQAAAALRAVWVKAENVRIARVGDLEIVHGTGKAGSARALEYCGRALVIVNREVAVPDGCWLIGPESLAETGALALVSDGARLEVIQTRAEGGARRWSQ